jgi:hypothetical protein
MRDLCYLHGFVIREGGDTNAERFEGICAEDLSAGAECEAFAATMRIFRRYPATAVVHYSKYERTEYRKLQRKYPEVATVEEIETLFALHRLSGLINGPRRAIRRCDDEEEGEERQAAEDMWCPDCPVYRYSDATCGFGGALRIHLGRSCPGETL